MRGSGFSTIGVFFALAAGLTGACLLELEQEIACGDGFVDEGAGEECDPGLRSSYVDACRSTERREGYADCDPVTCTLLNSVADCAVCGDGFVDEEVGEQCDGPNLSSTCPGGGEGRQCAADCTFDDSECDPCGNGIVEEGEECDPNDVASFTTDRLCAGSEGVDPLASGYKDYTSGQAGPCRDDCRFDRTYCGYCGDGTRDIGALADYDKPYPDEVCDGQEFDADRLIERFGPEQCKGGETERHNAGCGDDCRSFIKRWPEEPSCCRKTGTTCPALSENIRCCFAYDNPGEDPCEEFFEGNELRRLCR